MLGTKKQTTKKAHIQTLLQQGLGVQEIHELTGYNKLTIQAGRRHPLVERLKRKVLDFQRKDRRGNNESNYKADTDRFNFNDVRRKFGDVTRCYLTKRKINLNEPGTYHFDHVVPVSRGGSSDISNLEIACNVANTIKGNQLIHEMYGVLVEILVAANYTVIPPASGNRSR